MKYYIVAFLILAMSVLFVACTSAPVYEQVGPVPQITRPTQETETEESTSEETETESNTEEESETTTEAKTEKPTSNNNTPKPKPNKPVVPQTTEKHEEPTTEIQETETQEPETQEPETQEPENQEPTPQETPSNGENLE